MVLTNFSTTYYVQCNEHVEMNKFLCSLACTRASWMTIIQYNNNNNTKFYWQLNILPCLWPTKYSSGIFFSPKGVMCIDSQFYIIDSLFLDVSLERNVNLVVARL